MSVSSYYPTSFFGSDMPSAACLDCIAAIQCGVGDPYQCNPACL
jgi:hypothetical protein